MKSKQSPIVILLFLSTLIYPGCEEDEGEQQEDVQTISFALASRISLEDVELGNGRTLDDDDPLYTFISFYREDTTLYAAAGFDHIPDSVTLQVDVNEKYRVVVDVQQGLYGFDLTAGSLNDFELNAGFKYGTNAPFVNSYGEIRYREWTDNNDNYFGFSELYHGQFDDLSSEDFDRSYELARMTSGLQINLAGLQANDSIRLRLYDFNTSSFTFMFDSDTTIERNFVGQVQLGGAEPFMNMEVEITQFYEQNGESFESQLYFEELTFYSKKRKIFNITAENFSDSTSGSASGFDIILDNDSFETGETISVP